MEKEKNEDKRGKVICYYHGIDLDGKCSAAIVRRKYPDCELIGVDYPDRPDFEKIEPGQGVLIVDFSFSYEDMKELLQLTKGNLIWIDHHKSAIQKIKPLIAEMFDGKREIGKAGCELTWEYLFPDEPMPEAVRLLGRYDVWGHSKPETRPFQVGMRLNEWNPDNKNWPVLFKDKHFWHDIRLNGEIILKYEIQRNIIYAREMAFPVEFEGHKAWAINKALSNSQIFEKLEGSDERPLWILFRYKEGVWSYSLYSAPSSGIDISEITVKHGGGDHAGAAGFKSDKYLLEEKLL